MTGLWALIPFLIPLFVPMLIIDEGVQVRRIRRELRSDV